jgi:hypothetical protein
MFGVSRATAHRRVAEVDPRRAVDRRHQAILDRLGAAGVVDWSRTVVDSISVRAERGELTGPSPTAAQTRHKILLLCDRLGAAALWTGHGRWSTRSVSARKGAISSTP